MNENEAAFLSQNGHKSTNNAIFFHQKHKKLKKTVDIYFFCAIYNNEPAGVAGRSAYGRASVCWNLAEVS